MKVHPNPVDGKITIAFEGMIIEAKKEEGGFAIGIQTDNPPGT